MIPGLFEKKVVLSNILYITTHFEQKNKYKSSLFWLLSPLKQHSSIKIEIFQNTKEKNRKQQGYNPKREKSDWEGANEHGGKEGKITTTGSSQGEQRRGNTGLEHSLFWPIGRKRV